MSKIIFFLKFIVVFHLFSFLYGFFLAQGERKGLALVTRRLGPAVSYANGTLQALPDVFKFLSKSMQLSPKIKQSYYRMAAVYSLVVGFYLWFLWAYIGHGSNMLDVEYNFFFLLFLTVINVYGLVLGGYISYCKYAFLSSIRIINQTLSFDMFQNLLLLSLIAILGTVSFEELIDIQNNSFIFFPFVFLPLVILGFIALLLENFRAPFDLSEAEGEIITGYTIEYYGFLFFAFLFCEFLNL